MNDPKKLPVDHPHFTDPEWAIVGALTDADIYGKPPGYQVGPILAHLERFGWKLERIGPPEDYTDMPPMEAL